MYCIVTGDVTLQSCSTALTQSCLQLGNEVLHQFVDVTTQLQSEARIGSEFRLEQSYQISEEGNRIGLGFNLCVASTRTICGYVL